MKRFLQNISETLADAALLEMGVEVTNNPEHVLSTVHEPLMADVRRFFRNFSITMADAAVLELGVWPERAAGKSEAAHESIEENLIEVAFAEAADYDDIHEAILREHKMDRDIAHPDDCQYGDNDLCYV